MAYGAKFTHGSRSFDISTAEFDLFRDFIFPAADEALNIGSGTSGNRSGGKVMSRKAQDRWWAWSIRIQGASISQTHLAARRLSAWLVNALDDKSEKVFFEYRPNADIPEPIWGQYGAAMRWEVKAAIVDVDGSYYEAEIPSKALILPISLLVGPYASGHRDIMAQGMGAIREDNYGTADGLSRGLIVDGAVSNLVVNPSFETNTSGWDVTGGTIERTNEQAYYGNYGLRLTVSTTGNSAVAYLSNATTGAPLTQKNYVASARVYIPPQMVGKTVSLTIWESGGASAAEATVTKSLTPTTEGWKYIYASGVVKKADRTALAIYMAISSTGSPPAGSWVIWDCVQLVGPDIYNIYPYIDGDQLGCAWSGTAHASSSTATGGYARIPITGRDHFDDRQGTMIAALKMPYASADTPSGANNRIMETQTNLRVTYVQADSKIYIHDNTGAVGVAASWNAGDIIIVGATWGPDGMRAYFNSLSSASATYTNPGAPTYVYIGSNAASPPAQRILGTFLGFNLYKTPFTAAQWAAAYADIYAHVMGGDGQGQRLNGIPCLWTKDGDNQVDNCTDTNRNHYGIALGIQGSAPAETEIQGTLSADYHTVTLSNLATRFPIIPSNASTKLFVDFSGTADGAACGGQYLAESVGTSESGFMSTLEASSVYILLSKLPEITGKNFYILMRAKDSVSGFIRIRVATENQSVTGYGNTLTRPMATSTAYALYKSQKAVVFSLDRYPKLTEIYSYLSGYRDSGTNDLKIDYIVMFPSPMITVKSLDSSNSLTLIGNNADTNYPTTVTGEIVEFEPNKYNLLQSLLGDESHDPVITSTLTYTIYVTPRYKLL